MLLIFPSDPLSPRRPDEHFAGEYAAAKELDISVALLDHDAATRGEFDDAVRAVPASQGAVYRGWMLSTAAYSGVCQALARRGVSLRTSPQQYRAAHELPGWEPAFEGLTPDSVWVPGNDALDLAFAVPASWHAGVLRDYSKSMKHYWDEAMFIPDVHDANNLVKVAERFMELRGEDFAGGLVLRRFEDLSGLEVRSWWVDGNCVFLGPHPDNPGYEAPDSVPYESASPAVRSLGLGFVTVDWALRSDGVWRVVELGDGQVSDFPAGEDASRLLVALQSASLSKARAPISQVESSPAPGLNP